LLNTFTKFIFVLQNYKIALEFPSPKGTGGNELSNAIV